MGDGVMDEFIAFVVFLNMGRRREEKVRTRVGKKKCGGDEERVLTSVVTSRFRYSIQTRMGEFIDPSIALLQVRWKREGGVKS
jgi:hypothetical protein